MSKDSEVLSKISKISYVGLGKMTEDKPKFYSINKKDMSLFFDAVWIFLEKETATEDELVVGINNICGYCIIDWLRRNKLIIIDKKGICHKTRLGKAVEKKLEERCVRK